MYVCMNVCMHVRTLMCVLPVPVTGHVLRHRKPEVLGRAVRVRCWDNSLILDAFSMETISQVFRNIFRCY